MSSQQKRGFRLPWGPERASDADASDATAAATLDPASPDPTSGVESDDLGEAPFGLSDAAPPPTTEEAPASSEMPEDTAEAAMIDTQAQNQSTSDAADAGADGAGTAAENELSGAWPDVDSRTSSEHAGDADAAAARPPLHVTGDANGARPSRRENPLVAGLVKAMREAAISSREETMSRLNAEAETRVEGIRTRATTETAELRKRAEDDIAGIRDWSKAEIARVRQQTEDRIEGRRGDLASETERHAESVERLVNEVKSVVETFQHDMDDFFERLLAENDPARLAALAEQAPDAPDLSGDGPAAIDLFEAGSEAAEAVDASDTVETGEVVEASEPEAADAPEAVEAQEAPEAAETPEAVETPEALEADDAAAAEVAAGEGLDLGESNEWPAAALAAARRDEPQTESTTDDGATRLLVTGLGSVAGISALKGALGQLPGVHAVSVSSGERGEFVFAVSHDPGVDLASGIAGLPGFAARITDATDDGIAVVAHEPAA
jgi:hypothetical protein